MRVTGWSNGTPSTTGSGYGLRTTPRDRDRWFDRAWTHITIELDGDGTVTVPLSPSFWRTCTELRSAEIGRWMLERGLAPWPNRRPPAMTLTHRGSHRFWLSQPSRPH
jgi:hypothetical protein